MEKPIHVKPSFYSFCFQPLKEIALKYGYNLVLHGSLNRDMDLIACPWTEDLKQSDNMIIEFAEYLGGKIQLNNRKRDENGQIIGDLSSIKPHGRIVYIIDLNRESYTDNDNNWIDPQYYLDISVMPAVN